MLTIRFSSLCCLECVLFIIVAGTIGEVTLTFCDQYVYGPRVQHDVSQHASGVIITPNLQTGSAEFSTEGYPVCSVTLTNILDYLWCGIYITKFQLSHGERLLIQSGILGDYVEITQVTHEKNITSLHSEAR